jgi:anti-sigma regulatory factor (Ser/Thr protein kinase)
MDKIFTSYNIEDRSFVAFIKRKIHHELLQTNFTKRRVAEIDIIISELTSNLIKHAGSGELLYRIQTEDDEARLDIITIDQGPGISDVQRVMRDGISTSNTLGQGLGAIQRLSSAFEIYSVPKWGTLTYTVVKAAKTREKKRSDLEVMAICVPKPPEDVCGDAYYVKRSKDYIKIFLGDGLGHGERAHEAVLKAIEVVETTEENDPVEIIRQMHSHVRKTRGLVASVAVLNLRVREWRICGVGNIVTRLYGGILFKHYMAYNGIVGLNIPGTMNETVIPAEKNQQLIMCTDGLRTRWDVAKYPSILKHDGMLLAAALYKDFNRRTDDSSVFIGKVMSDK